MASAHDVLGFESINTDYISVSNIKEALKKLESPHTYWHAL